MTKFSFEVPLDHLNDFDDLQDFTFALSVLDSDVRYQRYLFDKMIGGLSPIWMDNSYNETQQADDPERLALLYMKYKCTRVISPDSPKWSAKQIAEAFQKTANLIDLEDIIVVVSSIEMVDELHKLPIRPVHHAVSYWTRGQWSNYSLQQLKPHFLGLLSVDELIRCKPPSCDTSMPIKLAIQRITLREWQDQGCPHIHTKDLGLHGSDFFNYKMSKQEIDLARENICKLKEATAKGLCNTKD